ncbi:hypothetical protein ABID97_001804 [Variovorax sp. OAS795]|uniref:hypothetical protein n=1 Tax=Variovorax sp. OAS795 TaxID=3034231 RepID=UPI0033920A7D
MTPSPIELLFGSLLLGMLGVMVVAWMLSRSNRRQLEAKLNAQLQAHLRVLDALAERHAQQPQQLLSVLEAWKQELCGTLHIIVRALPQSPPSSLLPAQGMDAVVLVEQLHTRIGNELEAQRQAIEQANAQADRALQQTLQRVPPLVQQAIQVELEFQAQQQAYREEARANERQRWQAEQDERRAAELQLLLRALAAQPRKAQQAVAAEPSGPVQHPTVPPPGTSAAPVLAVSARPPELLHTPLPRPQPTYEQVEPVPELSDEELDALPPELPELGKPRKRVLPAPKKPSLRSLRSL